MTADRRVTISKYSSIVPTSTEIAKKFCVSNKDKNIESLDMLHKAFRASNFLAISLSVGTTLLYLEIVTLRSAVTVGGASRYSRVPRQSAVDTDRGALSSAIPLLVLHSQGRPYLTVQKLY